MDTRLTFYICLKRGAQRQCHFLLMPRPAALVEHFYSIIWLLNISQYFLYYFIRHRHMTSRGERSLTFVVWRFWLARYSTVVTSTFWTICVWWQVCCLLSTKITRRQGESESYMPAPASYSVRSVSDGYSRPVQLADSATSRLSLPQVLSETSDRTKTGAFSGTGLF
jgi:hypothetical protein